MFSRWSYYSVITAIVLVGLFSSLLTVPFFVQPAKAQDWWNNNWEKRQKIVITESSCSDLTNFPIEVTLQHSGLAQTDGNDIRIIEGTTEIRSAVTQINSTHVTVVFQIDLARTESKPIYAYYGNPVVLAPQYPLVPLEIVEGNSGHATIDNTVYLGWDFSSWGHSNDVELWNDFRIDFNKNNDPTDDTDLLRGDYNGRQSGIARHRADSSAIGLGNYQGYVQNSVFVEIIFADATLRVYQCHCWVETTQADYMHTFSDAYTHMKYGGSAEENVVDAQGVDINVDVWDDYWNRHISATNFEWAAFRDSRSGYVFASTGINIGEEYAYYVGAKEGTDWDREINYCNRTRHDPVEAYDQPTNCTIYWYADDSNSYSEVERLAAVFNNPPIVSTSKLVIQSSPVTGITFTINGTKAETPYALKLLHEKYLIEMPQTQMINGIRYVFQSWADGNQNRIRTVRLDEKVILTAQYYSAPVGGFYYSPQTPVVGQTISFYASKSYDDDGIIEAYSWNFGDGSSPFTTNNPVTTYSYDSQNAYNVTLTVRDNEGLASTFSDTVLVMMPTTMSVSTNSLSSSVGFQIEINGYIQNKKGYGVYGVPVVISYMIENTKDWTYLTSTKTDSCGYYSANWFPSVTGYFKIKAEWKGNTECFGSSSKISIVNILVENQHIVSVESTSTITGLSFNAVNKKLSFSTQGNTETQNYAKITVPSSLVKSPENIEIYCNGKQTKHEKSTTKESVQLIVNYNQNNQQIEVHLEGKTNQSNLLGIILLIASATGLIVIIIAIRYKKKH